MPEQCGPSLDATISDLLLNTKFMDKQALIVQDEINGKPFIVLSLTSEERVTEFYEAVRNLDTYKEAADYYLRARDAYKKLDAMRTDPAVMDAELRGYLVEGRRATALTTYSAVTFNLNRSECMDYINALEEKMVEEGVEFKHPRPKSIVDAVHAQYGPPETSPVLEEASTFTADERAEEKLAEEDGDLCATLPI